MQLMRRRIGQMIRIKLANDVDPTTPIGEIFAEPVGLMLLQTTSDSARFAIYADDRLLVIEDELLAVRDRGS